jgi:hypothetical protein
MWRGAVPTPLRACCMSISKRTHPPPNCCRAGRGLAVSAGAGAAGGASAEEVRKLRADNAELVQKLVSKTMELAELSESEITSRRELTRLKEVYAKLQQRTMAMEAELQSVMNGKGKKR